MRVTLVTVSDSVSEGVRKDLSGPALRDRCITLGWEVVSDHVVPDDQEEIEARLVFLADSGNVDLILTTGGTGIGPRDATPEATKAVCEKILPGIGELMRARGLELNSRAVLSRAVAGTRGRALIVNLPGSPKGVVESFDAIAKLLSHAVDVLRGARHD